MTRRLIEAYTRVSAQPEAPNAELEVLTARERDVLQLVGQGMSNSDIAGKLTVTEATVKTHLYRTMTKLGLNSRAQAVAVAYENGLVPQRR
ncbi:response regulator transcription factor [Yinghuangia seranimata]|uniref:response regulator transcription factor n=1 Tax=Yinghuangia seranimata TaxID=408067 RepID=UPI0031BB3153